MNPITENTTMYQRAVTLQQVADFFDDANWTGAIREPGFAINSGTHPRYGAFFTVQDWDPEWWLIHTERPLDLPLPFHAMPADGLCGLTA